jgi:hypothetical protein
MMRAARSLGSRLAAVENPRVLMTCLSFDPGERIAVRVRSLGGDRIRWVAPWLTAALALAASGLTLALLLTTLGFNVSGGGGIAQIASLIALWVFYRTMRHAKPRASELRKRDARPPVLILRQFRDDTLMLGRLSFGTGPSFEHSIAGELDRMGPTISIGRPGERLPPLGASRDYLADADWKHAVGTLIEEAAVVVFLLGRSESLLWEFTTTVTTGGKHKTLVIVPPLPDRAELARRWEHFIQATADVVGTAWPRELPKEPVLALFFAGDDAVMITGSERDRSRPFFAQSAPDYVLALRLFRAILEANPASARDVATFLAAHMPIARVSGFDEGIARSRC